jgi:hypothetical protein
MADLSPPVSIKAIVPPAGRLKMGEGKWFDIDYRTMVLDAPCCLTE